MDTVPENLSQEINQLRSDLLSEIASLKDEVVKLQEIQKENNKKLLKMDSHIDFIDSVYTSVRKPLYYISSKVNYLLGNEEKLPEYYDEYLASKERNLSQDEINMICLKIPKQI